MTDPLVTVLLAHLAHHLQRLLHTPALAYIMILYGHSGAGDLEYDRLREGLGNVQQIPPPAGTAVHSSLGLYHGFVRDSLELET